MARLILTALLGLAPLTALAQPLDRGPRWASTATEAYLVSAASTVGAVGLGAALYRVLPGPSESGAFAPRDVGVVLVTVGILVGPSMGNVSLGAVGDARRGVAIKGAGVAAGAAIALGTLVVTLGCFASPECGSGAEAFAVTGAVVAGAGIVAGTAYDLATIPGNAAPRRPVSLGPGGAGLALTVGL